MQHSGSRWFAGSSRTRFQLAIVLIVTFAAILGTKFWEGSHVTTLRRDSNSLFADRLMPATMLMEMLDEQYMRRETLKHALAGGETTGQDPAELLRRHDTRQKEILLQFEQTFLVQDEQRYLAALRTSLAQYGSSESALLERRSSGVSAAYSSEMQARFESVREALLNLSQVQQDVGARLDTQSAAGTARVTSLLYFQLGAGFVLCMVAVALAMSLGNEARLLADPYDDLL